MKYQNKKNEIIEFCLEHHLIQKVEDGYIVKKYFFDLLDGYAVDEV